VRIMLSVAGISMESAKVMAFFVTIFALISHGMTNFSESLFSDDE
jgi:hypothetical protein